MYINISWYCVTNKDVQFFKTERFTEKYRLRRPYTYHFREWHVYGEILLDCGL
jgi:hypothetical protein